MPSKKPARVVLSSQMSTARIKLPSAALAWFMLNFRGLWEGGRRADVRCTCERILPRHRSGHYTKILPLSRSLSTQRAEARLSLRPNEQPYTPLQADISHTTHIGVIDGCDRPANLISCNSTVQLPTAVHSRSTRAGSQTHAHRVGTHRQHRDRNVTTWRSRSLISIEKG